MKKTLRGPMFQSIMNNITTLRSALLDLHRAVITRVREDYEREHGRVAPAEFLQLLVNDPAFAWLSPLSKAVVGIDEAIDDPEEADPAVAVAQVRSLFSPGSAPEPFEQLYEPLLHASPDVLFSHCMVKQALHAPVGV